MMRRRKQRGMSSGRVLAGMLVFCMAMGTTAGQTGLNVVRAEEVQQETEAEAEAQAESDFEYSVLADGTLEITKYTGTDAEVVVPGEIDGKKVTSIWGSDSLWEPSGAFFGCSSLTQVILPEGLTMIGASAFQGCSSLTELKIPESVTGIGSSAFEGCSSLTSITLPEGLTSLGYRTFSGCSSLTSITLPEGLKSLSGWNFTGCSSLTSITLPKGLTSFGHAVFSGCSSLTSITLPEGITVISDFTFQGCSSLTDITLPEGVTDICYRAFVGCTNLSLTVPASATNIGSYTFKGVANLQFEEGSPFTSENGVIYKNNTDLVECYNVKEGTTVTIPEGVTSLWDKSFDGLFPIDVIIPTSVTSIAYSGLGDQDFEGVEHSPVNIYYTGSEDQWKAIEGYDEIASYEAEGWVIMHYNYDPSAPTPAPTPDTPSTPQGIQSEVNTSSVSIAMSQESLADAVLTAEEKQLLADGAAVKVSLNVADATNTVSDADKAAVAAALGGYTLGQYLDISLSKTVNGNTSGVSETMAKLTLTIQVPEALKNTDATKIRRFAVIRIHNGQAELLKDMDDKEDTITIESDRFSTYAVVYQDEAKKQSPKTGEPGAGTVLYGALFMMLLAAGGIGIFCARRKREV